MLTLSKAIPGLTLFNPPSARQERFKKMTRKAINAGSINFNRIQKSRSPFPLPFQEGIKSQEGVDQESFDLLKNLSWL